MKIEIAEEIRQFLIENKCDKIIPDNLVLFAEFVEQDRKKQCDMHVVSSNEVTLPIFKALALDQPYSLIDIIKLLVEATDTLLIRENCDKHGWEYYSQASELAKEKLALLEGNDC